LDGESLTEIHPLFEKMAHGESWYNNELMEKIAGNGSVQDIDAVPESLKMLFKTSHEISPEWHIRIQAAFQKFTDNAVSKTVNFPSTATPEDVESVYRLAFRLGCKGVTIYRYGSRGRQVLNIGREKVESNKIAPRPRPERTQGLTERMGTGCGKLYVTVNSDQEGMCEVFAQMGKTGGCASSQIEAAGRLISLALRSGVKPEAIIKQLKGIRCPSPTWQNGDMILSCPDAIARVLMHVCQSDIEEPAAMMGVCPECSGVLYHEEGCLICRSCGFTKCS
jgi:ribonucleoside-diphosphate reductase alpha chain